MTTPASVSSVKEFLEQRRAKALACAQTLLQVGIQAGRGYEIKPITDDVEAYHIEWLNSDLIQP